MMRTFFYLDHWGKNSNNGAPYENVCLRCLVDHQTLIERERERKYTETTGEHMTAVREDGTNMRYRYMLCVDDYTM